MDVSAYEAKRFFATAKDGVKIPYTLIYRKGMKQDGSNPTWISAYGSYGLSAYTPTFASDTERQGEPKGCSFRRSRVDFAKCIAAMPTPGCVFSKGCEPQDTI